MTIISKKRIMQEYESLIKDISHIDALRKIGEMFFMSEADVKQIIDKV